RVAGNNSPMRFNAKDTLTPIPLNKREFPRIEGQCQGPHWPSIRGNSRLFKGIGAKGRTGHPDSDSLEQAGIPSDRRPVRPLAPRRYCHLTASFPSGSIATAPREAQTALLLAAR